MLKPLALLTALLTIPQFVQSTVTVTPTSPLTSKPSISSNSTAPPTVVNSTTTPRATAGGTSTVGNGNGGTTVSATKSGAHSVDQTASVPVDYIVWSAWRVAQANDCQKKCCDIGGPVITQIRNCTIVKVRCEGLNKCSDYGVIERDISCYTACACMRSSGRIVVAAVIITVVSNILAITCTLIAAL